MPFIIGGAIALTGGLGYLGAKESNETAVGMSREQMDWQSEESAINREFQATEALRNREFQDKMSSTAVQRRMADMERAGINPILAGKFDASTPGGGQGSGAQASSVAKPDIRNTLGEGIQAAGSALGMLKVRSEIDALRDQAFASRGAGQASGAQVGKIIAERDKALQDLRRNEFRTQVEEFKQRAGMPILGKESSGAKSLDYLTRKADKVFNQVLDQMMENW